MTGHKEEGFEILPYTVYGESMGQGRWKYDDLSGAASAPCAVANARSLELELLDRFHQSPHCDYGIGLQDSQVVNELADIQLPLSCFDFGHR